MSVLTVFSPAPSAHSAARSAPSTAPPAPSAPSPAPSAHNTAGSTPTAPSAQPSQSQNQNQKQDELQRNAQPPSAPAAAAAAVVGGGARPAVDSPHAAVGNPSEMKGKVVTPDTKTIERAHCKGLQLMFSVFDEGQINTVCEPCQRLGLGQNACRFVRRMAHAKTFKMVLRCPSTRFVYPCFRTVMMFSKHSTVIPQFIRTVVAACDVRCNCCDQPHALQFDGDFEWTADVPDVSYQDLYDISLRMGSKDWKLKVLKVT